ncbi:HNH endonuclease family protein [Streptomyces sp. CMB-StM0423]|uniref:HNH endonuclease family protein n=1 Tax=Streptomyces sp. CMB-StM0423 TaxID=2059884 RepID=UPI000C701E29|nr:HNH endonuclease family protein [Streptomyces sp. CMB-StM0423]AUH40552.1 HNH endonuclease [Streptomyces sp. CMB-StM0423]
MKKTSRGLLAVLALLAAILAGSVGSAAAVPVADPVPAAGAVTHPAPAAPVTLPLRTAIEQLPVAAESRQGYNRDLFRHWVDDDKDGCDTRAEVLIAEAIEAPEVDSRCRITGGRWYSYYDDTYVDGARGLDIDHLVPLAEAWDSGASGWSAERRKEYANDLGADDSLVAVTARSNRSKSDQDPSTWWVPAEQASCEYLQQWVKTKHRWDLTADTAELAALNERAARCPNDLISFEKAG